MSYIYLGCPYYDPSTIIQQRRYELASEACAILARHKIPVYSPIAAWHPTAICFRLPGDHEFWLRQDRAMMLHCEEAWFLKLTGWEESRGIEAEMSFLRKINKPSLLLDFDQLQPMCLDWLNSNPHIR